MVDAVIALGELMLAVRLRAPIRAVSLTPRPAKSATPAEADIAIRVFGFNCGRVFEKFEPVDNSTLMFLKLNDERVLPALLSADFEKFFRNTAYTEALSLQEINYLLNEAVHGDPMLEEVS